MTVTKQIAPPDLPSTADAITRDVKVSLNCTQIGRIESFDPATQTATIQLVINQLKEVKPDGTKIIQQHPVIKKCPVVTMFGGDSFINLPISPGDNCIVFFNDREIDQWMVKGDGQLPQTGRVHDFSDAIALVGIRHYQNSIASFLANGIRISFAADSRIDLQENAINSIAELFTHTGDMRIEGNIYVTGDWYGENGGQMKVKTDLIQYPGYKIADGRMVSGSFDTVIVENGIVIGGS